jgi:hypothetical protein
LFLIVSRPTTSPFCAAMAGVWELVSENDDIY